jgi:hypothetical protein
VVFAIRTTIPNQPKYTHLDHGVGRVPPTNSAALVLIDCLDAARPFQVMRIKLDCSCNERFFKARRVNVKNFFTELKKKINSTALLEEKEPGST